MGRREDLLIGAKHCLLKIGYGRTTSRDIVAASGANLAAIGYHYGSKDSLLNAALLDALNDFGEEIRQATEICNGLDADPIERFEAGWAHIVKTYSTHRQLLLASVEVFAQVDRVPVLRAAVSDGFQQGRESMVELFRAILGDAKDAVSEEMARATGSFFQALATGVMSQWLVDPARAPSAQDLANAVLAISRGIPARDTVTSEG
jgi:AcrR family transcriptional regulator